jgi:hypothetical protein
MMRIVELGRRLWIGGAGWLVVAAMMLGLGSVPLVAQTAQDIAGTWQGTMQVGQAMRIVVKISKGDGAANKSGWKGALYSIDSSNQATAIPTITLAGANAKFTIPAIEASYQGKLSADGASMAGMWTQGLNSYALNLTRVTGDSAWAIPEPDKPMALDADPTYEVVTIKPSDPNDGNRGFQTRGRHVREADRGRAGVVQHRPLLCRWRAGCAGQAEPDAVPVDDSEGAGGPVRAEGTQRTAGAIGVRANSRQGRVEADQEPGQSEWAAE